MNPKSRSIVSNPSQAGEYFFKFLLIGDAGSLFILSSLYFIIGVGKTSILQRYTANEFNEEYQVTVGAEFGSKLIELEDSTKVKLQIWDAVSFYFSFYLELSLISTKTSMLTE